jgi:hypothetical protein
MGLFFVDAATLQPVLREIILNDSDAFRDYLVIRPAEAGLPNVQRRLLINAVNKLGPSLERAAGSDVAALFRTWCQDVYTIHPDDQPNWFCYEETFRSWASNWRNEKRDSLGLGSACLERYEAVIDGKALHDAFDRNAKQQPSEWDRLLFSITHYTQSDRWQEHETNLYDAIFQTINRNRFQLFWEGTRDTLDNQLLTRIYQSAETVLNETTWSGEKPFLVKPLELRRKLPFPNR